MTGEERERRAHVLGALRRGDWAELGRLGWNRVFDQLASIFTVFDAVGRPTESLSRHQQAGYLGALGHFEAGVVESAVGEWLAKGESRLPRPADLNALLVSASPAIEERPRKIRRDLTDDSLGAVARAHANGEPICACLPPSRNMKVDAAGVIRCPECGGLETGQAETALGGPDEWHRVRVLAGYQEPDAESDHGPDEHLPRPTREDFARWNREVRDELAAEGKSTAYFDRMAGNGVGGFLKRMPEVTDSDLRREAEIMGYAEPGEIAEGGES